MIDDVHHDAGATGGRHYGTEEDDNEREDQPVLAGLVELAR